MPIKWTPELDEQLKGYIAAGLTPKEIAQKMSPAVSRGAISGRKAFFNRMARIAKRDVNSNEENAPPKNVLIALDASGSARVVGQGNVTDRATLRRGVLVYELVR